MQSDTTVAPPRARKPRGQGVLRRGEILAAAQRLFLELGFEHATMRRIAAEVGVSTTALYVYFPDKEHILRAIAESTFTELLAALETATAGAHPSGLHRLRAGLHAYVAFGRARPDQYRLTFFAKMMASFGPGRPPNPCADIAAADQSFAILQGSVERLIAEGTLAPSDPPLVAEALWACVHGVTCLLIDKADHLQSDPERLTDTVIDAAIAGLRAPAAPAG